MNLRTTWRMHGVENVTLQVTTPAKPVTRHDQVVFVIERAARQVGLPLERIRSAAPTNEEGTVEEPTTEPTEPTEPTSPPAEPEPEPPEDVA